MTEEDPEVQTINTFASYYIRIPRRRLIRMLLQRRRVPEATLGGSWVTGIVPVKTGNVRVQVWGAGGAGGYDAGFGKPSRETSIQIEQGHTYTRTVGGTGEQDEGSAEAEGPSSSGPDGPQSTDCPGDDADPGTS